MKDLLKFMWYGFLGLIVIIFYIIIVLPIGTLIETLQKIALKKKGKWQARK
jgi:hypothetical protein